MNDIIIELVGFKLACDSVLIAAHTLLINLSSLDAVGKEKCGLYLTEVETKQVPVKFCLWILVSIGF